MKSKFLVLYGVSQQGCSLGGKDSPSHSSLDGSLPFSQVRGLGEAQVSKRSRGIRALHEQRDCLAAKGTGSRSCTEEWLSCRCDFKDKLQLEEVTTHPSPTWWFDFQEPKLAKSQLEMEVEGVNTLSHRGVDGWAVCAGGGAKGAARRLFPGVRHSPVQQSGIHSTEIILFLPSDNFCAYVLQPGFLSASLPIVAGCITVFIFPAPL